MTERRLVVTAACTPLGQAYATITHPLIQAYAQKCGADFLAIHNWPTGLEHSGYAKWDYLNLLNTYDRILHIDTDMVVRPTTPNLFEVVEPGKFAGVDEYPFQDLSQENPAVDRYADMDLPMNVEPKFYLNVGLYLFGREHKHLFGTPKIPSPHYFKEQSHLNHDLHLYHTPQLLDPRYNYMSIMENAGLSKKEAYIVHYAGGWRGWNKEDVMEMMRRDSNV